MENREKRNWNKRNQKLKKIRFINRLKEKGCSRCGYDKCLDALHFHHRDPRQKAKPINDLKHHSFKFIIEETAKCELLCSNCHAEIHRKMRGFTEKDRVDLGLQFELDFTKQEGGIFIKCEKCGHESRVKYESVLREI